MLFEKFLPWCTTIMPILMVHSLRQSTVNSLMRRSNCSAPIPPGTPGTSLFLLPQGSYHLNFYFPALYNHPNHPFFDCPALFNHTHIFSDPGAAGGGGNGGRTIWPAHKLIISLSLKWPFKKSWFPRNVHLKSFQFELLSRWPLFGYLFKQMIGELS